MANRGEKIARSNTKRIHVSAAVIFAWAAMIVFTFTAISLTVALAQQGPASVQAQERMYVQ